ncbi:flotillin 1 [Hibiscus trionum]|uniref:Flotillin-like n=1 Tax=Hibiscus trionum TaxID=183268 RepID=A0A9W7GT91_HIBTR|nr:flotillin 1 [Hibiscus trionum]
MDMVAEASQYLALTGAGIQDIKLVKNARVLPGQTCTVLDLTSVNYTVQVQAMSAEKLPFVLLAVFAIGPRADDTDSLIQYARLMSSHHKESDHVEELVRGVIEGETEVIAAAKTMEEIFKRTEEFKREVCDKIQLELNQFGLFIYNANVQVQQLAANQAKFDVVEVGAKKTDWTWVAQVLVLFYICLLFTCLFFNLTYYNTNYLEFQ